MKKLLLPILMIVLLLGFASADLTTDNEVYYAFDTGTGTNALDSSVNANDGTLTDSPTWTTLSKLGAYALNFSGTDSYVQMPNSGLVPNANSWSVGGWYKTYTTTGTHTVFTLQGERNIQILRQGTNFVLETFDGTSATTSSTSAINIGQWYHVVGTYDGTTQRLYLNGALVDSDLAPTPSSVSINTRIGAHRTGNAGFFFDGVVDENFLYSRTISLSEVQESYNNNNGLNPYVPILPGIYISASNIFNDNSTTNINVTLNNGTSYINNSGNSIYLNFTDGIYTYTVSSIGFLSVNDTISHSNITIKKYDLIPTTSAPLDIRIYNSNTGALINQIVNVTVQSDTTEYINSTSNGNINFQPIFDIGEEYTIILSSSGAINYTTTTYDIIYNSDLAINGIDLFMTPFVLDGEFITFVAQRPDLTQIQGALVTVEKFVNGTYQIIGQKNTDIIGEAVFFLEPGKTHRITVTKDGFVTQTFISTLSQTVYTIIMSFDSDFDYDQGYAGISYDYTPKATVLEPDTYTFNFSVSAELQNLQYTQIFLRDNEGNVLATAFSNNPLGTTLSVTVDVSAFNGTFVTFDRRFKVDGFPEQRFTNNYNINTLEKFTGTLQELRSYLINDPEVTLGLRIALFSVFFIISMIVLATVITGLPNLLISLAIGLLVAWVVGVNLYIIAVIFLVLALLIFALNIREGT